MTEQLHRLSRFCGLQHSVLPNVLRRGSAYALSMHVSDDEKSARLGHTPGDTVYWNHYRNTTSTVDFQGKRHAVEERDVSKMSSVFLGTGHGTPPDRLSDAGKAIVDGDPQLIALQVERAQLCDQLTSEHGSLAAAKLINPEGYNSWVELGNKIRGKFNNLSQKQYNIEYKAFFDNRIPSVVPTQDNALQEHSGDESLGDIRPSSTSYAVDNGDGNGTTSAAGPYKMPPKVFGVRGVARHSLVDQVSALLYDQTPDTTWSSLSDQFVTTFNHLHPADQFYPDQEPFPGTYNCRFCDMFLAELDRGHALHAYNCAAKSLSSYVGDKLRSDNSPAVPATCPHLRQTASGSPAACNVNIASCTPAMYMQHFTRRHALPLSHGQYSCLSHEPVLRLDVIEDAYIHAVQSHGIPLSLVVGPKRGCSDNNFSHLIYFCPFCQVWIPRTDEFEESHLRTHISDLITTVAKQAIAGNSFASLWTHPGFCVFCLYNDHLTIKDRMVQFKNQAALGSHVAGHLTSMKENALSACPATMPTSLGLLKCNSEAALDRIELTKHLIEDHHYTIKVANKGSTSAKVQLSVEESVPVPYVETVSPPPQLAIPRKRRVTGTSTNIDGVPSYIELTGEEADAIPIRATRLAASSGSNQKYPLAAQADDDKLVNQHVPKNAPNDSIQDPASDFASSVGGAQPARKRGRVTFRKTA